jgi:hypothetical protein
VNPLLWTPTRGQDVTRSLFPLHGSKVWPEIAAVLLVLGGAVLLGWWAS